MIKQIVITDSTSDLSEEYSEANSIHVIPLSLTIEGASYIDQVDITSEEFINHIENDEDVKTSQPAIGEFILAYGELGKDGSEIISTHLSSGLSGIFNTAYQVSQMVSANVTVIDSKSISLGLGYQIQYLVELVKGGVPTSETVKKSNHSRENIKLFVAIGQSNQLIRGGRISKAKGLIGNLMKIRPIDTLDDGRLELVYNARTQNSSIQYLKKEIAEFIGDYEIKSVGVAHANAIEYVDKLKKVFNEAFHVDNYDINVTTSVVSAHTGQGAIGLAVLKK